MRDHPDEAVVIAGVRGRIKLEDILHYARRAGRIAPVQAVRHDLVLGDEHVRSAALHARRAMAEGRGHADRLEVEFTRYLAGERQIHKALAKMGLPEEADAAVAVALGERRLDAIQLFLHQFGLEEDDGLIDATPEKLRAFGITAEALAATTPERQRDLVLEAVAAVDLAR